jgi:sugar/nucleoside kinase (ribokinase family)
VIAGLTAEGVEVEGVQRWSQRATRVALLLVDERGDRVVIETGRNGSSPAPPKLRERVAQARVLHLDVTEPAYAMLAAHHARESGTLVSLDVDHPAPGLDELLPLVDIAICSSDFAPPGGAPPSSLLDRGVRRVAITRGPEPILWWSVEPAERRAPGVSAEQDGVPVPPVLVRDTLGAGDVFHGAFAWHLADRPDRAFADQLARSAVVAAARCQVAGISAGRAQLARRSAPLEPVDPAE